MAHAGLHDDTTTVAPFHPLSTGPAKRHSSSMLYLPQQTPTAPTPAAVPTLMRSLSPGLDPLLRSHLPFSKLSVPPPPIGRFILLVMVLGVLRPAHPSVGSPSSGTTEDLDSGTRMLRPSSGEQSWPWTPRVSTPSKQASEQGERATRRRARTGGRAREGASEDERARALACARRPDGHPARPRAKFSAACSLPLSVPSPLVSTRMKPMPRSRKDSVARSARLARSR